MEGVNINSDEQLDFLIDYLMSNSNSVNIPDNFSSKRELLRALMNIRMPGEVSDDFLKIQDEFLTQEVLSKTLTSPEDILKSKGKIKLWQGDITTLKVDAIVNAANSKLLGCFIPNHNCIDNVIHSQAGIQLREECNSIMTKQGFDEDVGCAKITSAYNLPSKYVIHTVGPAISYGAKPSKRDCDDLTNCYNSCLNIADEYNLQSLAFCCISTGVFNFPQKKAAEIAVKTVEDYLKTNNDTSLDCVIFNVFLNSDYSIYDEILF